MGACVQMAGFMAGVDTSCHQPLPVSYHAHTAVMELLGKHRAGRQ